MRDADAAVEFWCAGAEKWFSINSNLVIEIDEEGQYYSSELILWCHVIAMSNEIDRLTEKLRFMSKQNSFVNKNPDCAVYVYPHWA